MPVVLGRGEGELMNQRGECATRPGGKTDYSWVCPGLAEKG